MADVMEHSRKRSRLGLEDEDEQRQLRNQRKVSKTSNAQSFLPTTPKNSFLRLHLQILKSLYVPDTIQASFEVKDDENVQEDVFGAIEQFVKQRRQLTGLVQKVKLNKAVQEEAAKCLTTDNIASQEIPTPMAIPSNEGLFAARPMSQQSPYGLGGIRSTGLSQQPNYSGANLLAALLKRKYLIADRSLRRETHAFHDLLSTVKERIGTIDTLLAEQKEAPGLQTPAEHDPLGENDYRREMIARLETKHCLWSMLLKDMEAAYDL